VTVETPIPITDLAQRVAEALRDAHIVEIIEDCPATRVLVIEERPDDNGTPSFIAMFADFLSQRPLKDAEAARVQAAFAIVLQAAEAEEDPVFPELADEEVPA
jgi:hypothetical protein